MSNTTEPLSFQSLDGLMLAGERAGQWGAPSVVLLHGGGQTRASWGGAMRELASRGYYAVSLDARGHGASAWASNASEYSLPLLASDLKVFIESLPNPPALVGASMGGLTALHAIGTAASPLASALVLVDVVPRMEKSGAERVLRFMKDHRDGFASIEDAAAAVAAYNPHRPPPRTTEGLMKNLRASETGRLLWHWDPQVLEMTGIGEADAQDELLENCRRFVGPTLLIRGMQSDILSDAGIAELRGSLPQLEVFDVAVAGHMIAGDKNDVFNHAMLQFLDRHLPA
jgi:pimeloyl-ACP methyl ester carboxylesterase